MSNFVFYLGKDLPNYIYIYNRYFKLLKGEYWEWEPDNKLLTYNIDERYDHLRYNNKYNEQRKFDIQKYKKGKELFYEGLYRHMFEKSDKNPNGLTENEIKYLYNRYSIYKRNKERGIWEYMWYEMQCYNMSQRICNEFILSVLKKSK